MAQFGPGATEISEARSFSTPQQGVVREPVAIQGAANIFDQLNDISESKREKKRVAFLGDFMTRQLAEVQAVDQGVRGSQAASSRIRVNLANAINNYPSLAEDLLSANNKILGKAGLGEVVTEGTEEEQQWERITDTLIDSGQIKPGASQNRIEEAYENLQLAKEAERRYNARMRTLKLESKEFANDELREEATAKAQRERAIDTLPAKMDQFNNNLDKIVGGLQGNEFDQSTARQALDELWANFNQEVTPFMSDMSETEASALKKPFEMKLKIARKVVSGEYDTEAAKAETERAKSTALAIALRDPKVLKSVMLSEIFPNAPLSKQIDDVNLALGGIFGDNLDPESDQPANLFRNTSEGRQAVQTYLDTIENVEDMNDPEARQKAEEEQATHLMKIFEGVEEYENTIAKDPKRAIDLTRWMAKPSFYDVRIKHKDKFQNTDTAMRVLQTHYGNEVVEMVDREFRKEGVVIGQGAPESGLFPPETETTSTDKLVRYEWTGDSIRFMPIEDGPSGTGIGQPAKEAARRLNEQLAPIINNQVRAAAHLEGNKNYETYFNKIEERLLSGGGEEQVEGSQGEDDLSLEDFVIPTISSEGLPEEVAQDEEFLSEVRRVGDKHEIDPNVLLGIMDFETGGTFDPAQKNAAGSSGTGLIQFMANTAESLGTSTKKLSEMKRSEQMVYVDKYLSQFGDRIKGADAEDAYMAVLFPKAMDKPGSYVLFKKGTKAYTQNSGLDSNGDGKVTKREASRRVVDIVGVYENRV